MNDQPRSGAGVETGGMEHWAIAFCAMVLLVIAGGVILGPLDGGLPWVNHDAALVLRLAGDLADGHALYVDRIEVNPPAVFVWNLVAVGVARLVGASPITTFHLLVIALAGVGLWSLRSSTRSTGRATRVWTVLAYALVAVAFGSEHFGQRPHLFLIVFVPYLMRRAHDDEGLGRLAWPVALGWAASMKPHYVALVAVAEAVLLWRDRRPSWPRWGALVAGALLPLAVLGVVSPGSVSAYFGDVVPLVRGSGGYAAFDADPGRVVAGRWGLRAAVGGVALAGLAVVSRLRRRPGWETALVCGLPVVAAAMVVQQGKFYGYHFVPVVGLTIVLGVWGGARVVDEIAHESVRRYIRWAAAMALGLGLIVTTNALRDTVRTGLEHSAGLARWTEGRPRVLVLSSTVAAHAEAAACEDVWRLVGRWGAQRLRVQVLLGEAGGDVEAAAGAYRAEIAEEIAATEPDLVFVSITRSPALGRSLAEVLGGTVLPGSAFERVPDDEVARLGHAWQIFEVYRRRPGR